LASLSSFSSGSEASYIVEDEDGDCVKEEEPAVDFPPDVDVAAQEV